MKIVPVPEMTFIAWLKKQKDRDDPIGDLAKDFIDDTKRRNRRKFTVEYLRSVNACSDAIKAFNQATKEYWIDMRS